MDSHLQSAIRRHLDLTCVKLNDTQAELSKTQAELKSSQITIRKLEEKFDTPKFIWKINNFAEKLKQAKSGRKNEIASPPFYTKRYGHKLKVLLYPNGEGIGVNTHLLTSFVATKSEYDAILPWPLVRNVKVTLVDQQDDQAKQENFVTIRTLNFKRPEEEEGVRCGGVFISHRKLQTRRYLVGDAFFLQFEILPA